MNAQKAFAHGFGLVLAMFMFDRLYASQNCNYWESVYSGRFIVYFDNSKLKAFLVLKTHFLLFSSICLCYYVALFSYGIK